VDTDSIGLNTLQRLYNCTRPNRTETDRHRVQALPYDWSPSKWIVPSCVSESGAAPAAELILPARGPSKLWNPSPASLGQSLLRRKAVSRHTTPQPDNSNWRHVVISSYNNGQPIGITLYQWTLAVGVRPVGIELYQWTRLITTDRPTPTDIYRWTTK
jgi:hypothetical protein